MSQIGNDNLGNLFAIPQPIPSPSPFARVSEMQVSGTTSSFQYKPGPNAQLGPHGLSSPRENHPIHDLDALHCNELETLRGACANLVEDLKEAAARNGRLQLRNQIQRADERVLRADLRRAQDEARYTRAILQRERFTWRVLWAISTTMMIVVWLVGMLGV